MEYETINLLLTAIIAAGSLLAGIAAIVVIPNTIKNSSFKDELRYGDGAKERYKEMEVTVSDDHAVAFGPFTYGGGNLKTPKFTLTKFRYDKVTMGLRNKNFKRVASFYYVDDKTGTIMVRGWYLKKW